MYYCPPRTGNRSIIVFLSTSPSYSLLTLETFPAPSEALLDATEALLATSDSETLTPGSLGSPSDLSLEAFPGVFTCDNLKHRLVARS